MPRQQETILAAFKEGSSLSAAAGKAHIRPLVLKDALRDGMASRGSKYHYWARECMEARAVYEDKLRQLMLTLAADKKDWKGVYEQLKRLYSEEWGEKNATQVVQHQHSIVDKVAALNGNQDALPSG